MSDSARHPSLSSGHRLIGVLVLIGMLCTAPVLAQDAPTPNDPRYTDQWALTLIGAQCAWGRSTGSADVTVAVIDTGVDMQHPDLIGQLRSDGYDFLDDDHDPNDENGHGTNVAGIIAATLDNFEGITGLAPQVQLLPIRTMNARGKGNDQILAKGIRYAVDSGAQVINLSLGATLMLNSQTSSQAIADALSYAQDKGALVVVSAGNDFVPLPNAIVGDNQDVLVVAATDQEDQLASFSNYGSSITVAAPGVHILSTMPEYKVYLTSDAMSSGERFQEGYDYMSGTSQAAPFVSALAALLFSTHPDWDAQQVRAAIQQSAVSITEQNATLAAEGQLSAGRIDACAALTGSAAEVAASTVETTNTSLQSSNNSGALASLSLAVLLLAVLFYVLQRDQQPGPQTSTAWQEGSTWGTLRIIGGPIAARQYALTKPLLVIGRAPESDVVLAEDRSVSRRHATLQFDGKNAQLTDSGSTHGCYLNGRKLRHPAQLRRGDILQLGQVVLRFDA